MSPVDIEKLKTLMEQGYEEMANINLEIADMFFKLEDEVDTYIW